PLPKGEGETKKPASLLLVGNVDYGGEPGVMLASADTHRGDRAIRDGKGIWPPLKNTLMEVATIERRFTKQFGADHLKTLEEKEATEQDVQELAPQYRFLHFATHGFFAEPSVKSLLAPKDRQESELQEAILGR